MNAKPGWPVFATVLCFCVIGVLTLHSYQRQNSPKAVVAIESNVPVLESTLLANDLETNSESASNNGDIYPAIEVAGCSIESQLAGTAEIGDLFMEQQQIAMHQQPEIVIDAKSIESASLYAADIARAALMRGGFGFTTTNPQVVKADLEQSEPVANLDSSEPTPEKITKKKTRAKLASYRMRSNSTPKTEYSEFWESSKERLIRMKKSILDEAKIIGTKLQTQYELHQIKESVRRIGDRVRRTWFGELIQKVVAPRKQLEFEEDIDLSIYA